MRIICDGHEYRVTSVADMGTIWYARNNYGTIVAEACAGAFSRCWHMTTLDDDAVRWSETFSAAELQGYTIPEQLVRWYTSVREELTNDA